MRRFIEFVCTANNGRSPIAELIGTHIIDRAGLLPKIGAASSGSHLDEIRGEKTLPNALYMVKLGLNRDIYGSETRAVTKAISDEDLDVLTRFADAAEHQFHTEERTYRTRALQRLAEQGITGTLKIEQEQTLARPNRIYVFPIAERNTDRIVEIYNSNMESRPELIPPIETLGVANAFGQTEDAYQAVIDELVRKVPKAVERGLATIP